MSIKSDLRLFFILGAFVALPLALSACDTVVDDQTVAENLPPPNVQHGPPQVEAETIPVIEDPQSEIWRPGYWAMVYNQFVWVPGKVMSRPSPTAVWATAHWAHHLYGWTFEEGHWE